MANNEHLILLSLIKKWLTENNYPSFTERLKQSGFTKNQYAQKMRKLKHHKLVVVDRVGRITIPNMLGVLEPIEAMMLRNAAKAKIDTDDEGSKIEKNRYYDNPKAWIKLSPNAYRT
jgi:translation initiation factor IF-2